ncbi:hypothetical protein BT96DRAFT_428464 [Gymnopus androsaceus JB14]|uniref:Uncharacterized protein n=1 Tax=Gymnopus androsaceus JB14 TaxID=1447944 RepID=A0A6A4GSG0_9AGAR|nr:hypothetical protein BT96DRAFT_428464 [Gymnopus androsaceus JB14]
MLIISAKDLLKRCENVSCEFQILDFCQLIKHSIMIVVSLNLFKEKDKEDSSKIKATLDVVLVNQSVDIGAEALKEITGTETTRIQHTHKIDKAFSAVDETEPIGQALMELGSPVNDVLDKIESFVKIIDEVSKIHPFAKIGWAVVSSLYKHQCKTDQNVINLVIKLKEAISYAELAWSSKEKTQHLEEAIIILLQQTIRVTFLNRK